MGSSVVFLDLVSSDDEAPQPKTSSSPVVDLISPCKNNKGGSSSATNEGAGSYRGRYESPTRSADARNHTARGREEDPRNPFQQCDGNARQDFQVEPNPTHKRKRDTPPSSQASAASAAGGTGGRAQAQYLTIDSSDNEEDDEKDQDYAAAYDRESYGSSAGSMSRQASQESRPSQDSGGGAKPAAQDGPKETKEAAKLRKEEKKRQQQLEREQKKRDAEAEKERKAQARLAAKAAKEQQKAQDKVRKTRQKLEQAVATGKFICQEVACVVDEDWLFSLTENDRHNFKEAATGNLKVAQALEPAKGEPRIISVFSKRGKIRGGIWWTKRSHLEGGAAVDGPGVETIDKLFVVIADPVHFCDMLGSRGYTPNTRYPRVSTWVDSVLQAAEGRRVVIVLQGVQSEMNRRVLASRLAGAQPAELEHIDDVVDWLLIQRGVETWLTDNAESTGQYLYDTTFALAEDPYIDETTKLSTTKKRKASTEAGDPIADIYLRQLMCIPGVCEAMARAVFRHYPSVRRLVDAFTTHNDPANLLTDKLANRRQPAASKRIYQFYTSSNPQLLLR